MPLAMFREQNSKPFIESKRAVQMFSTEKELKILNSSMIEYGMILNVTQSKANGKTIVTFLSPGGFRPTQGVSSLQ